MCQPLLLGVVGMKVKEEWSEVFYRKCQTQTLQGVMGSDHRSGWGERRSIWKPRAFWGISVERKRLSELQKSALSSAAVQLRLQHSHPHFL